ncbi:MAG: restriction endonuclease subunit S [Paludibacteraceae bacterium]|nr:restriction endonuclease subunit S [Paludibacteraceae bacterium]
MEWKTVKLGDYIDDIAAGPFGSNLKVECFVEDGFPIIDGANLRGFTVTDNVTKFVTEEKARSLHRAIATRGEVIVTISGNVGQIAYIPNDSRYNEYLVSQRQFRVRFKDTIDVPYLVYYMHSREGQHKILSFANQTGVPALAQPLKNFRNIELPLPPIETQRRIAAILSSLDDKIENNNRINRNLEAQAQALFKSWFVDFEPWGGTMPEDWKEGTLGEIVSVKRGGSPRPIQDYLSDKGYRWLKISDATAEASPFISHIVEHIKEEGLNKTVFIKQGSLVLSNSATPGLPKFVDLDTCIHDGWLYFPQSYFSNEYLYLLFQRERPYLLSQGNGSVFTNLKTDIVKNLFVIIPTERVLNSFQQIVGKVFTEILNNQRENSHLAALRDTLLPKLMKGEIAVA